LTGIALYQEKFIYVNPALEKITGYTKEELLKLTFQDITHPDDLDLDLKNVNQLLDGSLDTFHMEKRYIRKNKNVVWVNLSVIVMRDSIKQPLYFISIIQDISQTKMLMFELESKKNEFENIIRFAPTPIMIYDEEGSVIMINKAFSDLTGYLLKDIPSIQIWNKKVIGFKNSIDTEMIKTLFEDNMSIDEGQIKVLTKSGEELIWIHSLAPLGNIYNGKKMIIYSATDITKMQEREEMMLAQSRQAAMGDMIGMIAHQWRQPLSVISMAGNNLRADLELEEEITSENLYELTNILNEQTQSLSHTIDDFRTFMKPEKSKERVILCDIYVKLRNMIEKTLQNNEVTLNFINDCDVEFYTFTNELIQVFINLLNNSKDAFKERNIKNAKIDIITTIGKDLLTIEVNDNAGGIDKTILDELGKPYISTKSKNGTGLGIYMSKMILEKHFNGIISWKNSNNGTSFTIELPLGLEPSISENKEDLGNFL
jgi:PAS domain S-box-containing protein